MAVTSKPKVSKELRQTRKEDAAFAVNERKKTREMKSKMKADKKKYGPSRGY